PILLWGRSAALPPSRPLRYLFTTEARRAQRRIGSAKDAKVVERLIGPIVPWRVLRVSIASFALPILLCALRASVVWLRAARAKIQRAGRRGLAWAALIRVRVRSSSVMRASAATMSSLG